MTAKMSHTQRNVILSRREPAGVPIVASITISVQVINRYELYDTVTTTAVNRKIPAPPIGHLPETDDEADAFETWAYEEIYCRFTGTGHSGGDSWYDVTVTACSAAWLVDHEFEWGY